MVVVGEIDRARVMIEVFENFIVHYVDKNKRAFAYNYAFSELGILFTNGFTSGEADIITISMNSFVLEYDKMINYFIRPSIITSHLSNFKEKLGCIPISEERPMKPLII